MRISRTCAKQDRNICPGTCCQSHARHALKHRSALPAVRGVPVRVKCACPSSGSGLPQGFQNDFRRGRGVAPLWVSCNARALELQEATAGLVLHGAYSRGAKNQRESRRTGDTTGECRLARDRCGGVTQRAAVIAPAHTPSCSAGPDWGWPASGAPKHSRPSDVSYHVGGAWPQHARGAAEELVLNLTSYRRPCVN